MATPTILIEADFLNNNTYSTDLTGYLTGTGTSIDIDRGVDENYLPQGSQLTIQFLDPLRVFTIENSFSVLYGKLQQGVKLRVKVSGTIAWQGFISNYTNQYDAQSKQNSVSITADDISLYANFSTPISVAIQTTSSVSAAMALLLGQIPTISASNYTLDSSDNILSNFWIGEQPSFSFKEIIITKRCGASEDQGSSWVNPTNAILDDAVYATWTTVDNTSKEQSSTLRATDFQFNIPTTINNIHGIEISIEAKATAEANIKSVELRYSTYGYGNLVTTPIPLTTSDTAYVFGSSQSLAGSNSGQYESINSNTFGVDIIFEDNAANTAIQTISVDSIQIRIHYASKYGESSTTTSSEINVWQQANDVANHELAGFFYTSKDSKFIFKKASNMMGSTVSRTWGQGTSILPISANEKYRVEDMAIKSKIKVMKYDSSQSATAVIWSDPRGAETNDSRLVPERFGYTAYIYYETLSTPITPVANVDYKLNSLANGTGTDYIITPPGAPITVSFGAFGSNGGVIGFYHPLNPFYITKLQIRGTTPLVQPNEEVSIERIENTPITFIGTGTIDHDFSYYGDIPLMRNYTVSELKKHRYYTSNLILDFLWGDYHNSTSAVTTDMIALELGELVRYKDTGGVETGLGINEYYRVIGIKHHIAIGELFQTEVTLTPSHNFRNPTAIVYDDFKRPDIAASIGTPPTGTVWTAVGAAMSVSGNRIKADTAGVSVVHQTLGTSNQVVEAKFSSLSASAVETVGLTFSYLNSSNYYYAYWDDVTNRIDIQRVSAGATTYPAFVSYTPNSNGRMELRVIKIAGLIRVWVDGKLIITYEDGSPVNGNNAGILIYNTTLVYCDGFYAQGL